jgi:ribonuclease HII
MKKVQSKPNFSFETPFFNKSQRVCGIDEVGRGAWAGPVVAAAVVLGEPLEGLRDSKTLTHRQRETLYSNIIDTADTGIGWATPQEVDTLNIVQATFLAMRRAVGSLKHPVDHALIDGNAMCSGLPCPATTIVKGDQISLSIAAASIIAKVARDRYMHMLGTAFPAYEWQSNVGYGVQKHSQALAQHGACVHHRQSFKPVKRIIDLCSKTQHPVKERYFSP